MPKCSKIQLVENLQWGDVHPLEEAHGFHALLALEQPNYTIEQIAAKVGTPPRLHRLLREVDIACSGKRTGHNKLLFAVVSGSADACTDLLCRAAKLEAHP